MTTGSRNSLVRLSQTATLVLVGVVIFCALVPTLSALGQQEPELVLAPAPNLAEIVDPPATAFETAARADNNDGFSVRIKDITFAEGRRTIKLTGFGLVAGLNGTGGRSPVTRQSMLNLLERLGQRADPTLRALIRTSAQDKTDNLSFVIVTAEIDFAQHKIGNQVDVIVSVYDDATSLQGGVLLFTPLEAADGEVYAVASGPVTVGGFAFSGDASTVQKNHPNTGRVIRGATIEKDICKPNIVNNGRFRLNLINPDLETAIRIGHAVNDYFPHHSRVVDSGTVEMAIPAEYVSNPEYFVALVDSMRVVPDVEAKVVINERTGTVVIGDNVRLARVAITHANLAVLTGEFPQVSQPAPFSQGETAVVPRTTLDVIEEKSSVNVIDEPVTVGDLARALNALGVAPRDLGAIFQMLRQHGALQAKLEFQ